MPLAFFFQAVEHFAMTLLPEDFKDIGALRVVAKR